MADETPPPEPWSLDDPKAAPYYWGGLGVVALLLVLLMYASATDRAPLLGFIGGRHPPPVAGPTGLTYAATPSMRNRFVGTYRVRAAALADPATLEDLGQAAAAEGVIVRRVAYRVEGKRVVGLLGLPAGEASAPGVVLCHPWDDPYKTGLHTEDSVLGLARAGFLVLAPDYRGWGASEGEKGGEVVDVVAGLRALRAHPRCGPKVGLVGFSFGGGVAARAAQIETAAALVLYYPQLGGTYEELRWYLATGDPGVSGGVKALAGEARSQGANDAEVLYVFRRTSPLFGVERIGGPVLLLHGEADKVVSIRQSAALERSLRAAGKEVELKRIPGLDHAFANSAANPTWGDLVAFLEKTLR